MDKKTTEAPKSAVSKPSITAIVAFVIIVLLTVPNAVGLIGVGIQFLFFLGALFLAIPGLIVSYHTGLSLAKNVHLKKQSSSAKAYLRVGIMQAVLLLGSFLVQIVLFGYPIKACFDTCQSIEVLPAILIMFAVELVLFVPAYFTVGRYYKWTREYDLVNDGTQDEAREG